MSTVGEKVSNAAGHAADFVFNPATAAQVVGRDAIAMLIDRAMAVNSSDSLISFTQAARVEPNVLVDTDALHVEELHDILQSLQSIFAGYYLQAIQLDSTIGNVKVMETLNRFNPNGGSSGGGQLIGQALKTAGHANQVRRLGHGVGPGGLSEHSAMATLGGGAAHVQDMFATESYRDALPDFTMVMEVLPALEGRAEGSKRARTVESPFATDVDYKNWRVEREVTRAEEQDVDSANQRARQFLQDDERNRDRSWKNAEQTHAANKADEAEAAAAHKAREEANRVSVHLGDDTLKDIKEASNLSVGKMIDIEIKNNGQTFQVPIAIRLVVRTCPSGELVHILSLNQHALKSASDRYHGWKAGRLSFVKDLIFCRDLVDAHRRSLMKTSDSVYHNVVKNEKRSLAAAFLGGVPSVAAASNMLVTTTNTIEEIELTMPGKWSDFNARQQVFQDTSLMIVAVIDKEWNRVTFYHRGLPDATEVSFRDIKVSNKNGGPDVSDILKAYTLGNSPRL